MITGKLEITAKINELPQPKILENSWQQFDIDCDGRIISVTKPKVWKKLTDTVSNYPQIYSNNHSSTRSANRQQLRIG
ncbi:hypothetical protein [Nostoc sp. C052]|uniref:hypothetical protein n=1 Tax=Nostoc sp. C052 TaxID=2576902 RepID=UPI002117E918|nr:hypothetical protein [Nostoc sp. C052]